MSGFADFYGAPLDTSVAEHSDYSVIPPGDYICQVDKAEVKPTKANNGWLLEVQLTVVDGSYTNRKLWDRINIINPSVEAAAIGKRTLIALGNACGYSTLGQPEDLLQKYCMCHVKVKEDQNKITDYKPIPQAATPVPVAAPVPMPAPQHYTGPQPPQAAQYVVPQVPAVPFQGAPTPVPAVPTGTSSPVAAAPVAQGGNTPPWKH